MKLKNKKMVNESDIKFDMIKLFGENMCESFDKIEEKKCSKVDPKMR